MKKVTLFAFIVISGYFSEPAKAATFTINIRGLGIETFQGDPVGNATPILFQAFYDPATVRTESSGSFDTNGGGAAAASFQQSVVASATSLRIPEYGVDLSAGRTELFFEFGQFSSNGSDTIRPGFSSSFTNIQDPDESAFFVQAFDFGDGNLNFPFFDLRTPSEERAVSLIQGAADDVSVAPNTAFVSVNTPGLLGSEDPDRKLFVFSDPATTIEIVQGQDVVAAEELALLPDRVTPEGAFEFVISEELLAGLETIWIDPEIAVGYVYDIENALFATVTAPSLASVNDPDGYLLSYVFDGRLVEELLLAEQTYDFIAPVDAFTISGIDTLLMLDPTDTLAFRTGFTATDVDGPVSVRQRPITILVDDAGVPVAPVPLPAGWALLMTAFVALRLRRCERVERFPS